MRNRIINFLKTNQNILEICWKIAKIFLKICSLFVKIDSKTILFASFGGRKYDDSPKAIYDEICLREEFKDYKLIWAFVNPNKYRIPRGEKVKIDTYSFFKILLQAKIWVSNSGMDRGIELERKGIIKVETWHGTPLKKIGGEENKNSLKRIENLVEKDKKTIRCAQSEYDREIFSRIFNAEKSSILLSDLPRNDKLLKYTQEEIKNIKKELNIDINKKVILYTPTYREYLINENSETYIAPPINLKKWKAKLGKEYILLIRAHYAVNAALEIKDDDFVKNVSDYYSLNNLYIVSDMMISDYSSTYFDYSILSRPMYCFAYDLEEYKEKRGLYLELDKSLPCKINKTEDELIKDILNSNYEEKSEKTYRFHKKYSPYAGNASKIVVDEILKKLKEK
ncbi:CDP-glycerol glycerophosphotransferase family protein [uncultured Fusobacterium sp.]|uniref:CDP-glycerol glycerophosphotransferase family protein n=1 Tax=uncultured Fusobacterium sp. TaxID=159267 RepID=UPI0025958088|nr:CDP-glycerol glycerophosphotransferase family protein [uncultured Fusobacterium sp.]